MSKFIYWVGFGIKMQELIKLDWEDIIVQRSALEAMLLTIKQY